MSFLEWLKENYSIVPDDNSRDDFYESMADAGYSSDDIDDLLEDYQDDCGKEGWTYEVPDFLDID